MYTRRDRLLVMAVIVVGVMALAIFSCSPSQESSLMTRARQLEGQTPICVENEREHYMRVEILGGPGREELSDIPVHAFTKECEWVSVAPYEHVAARITSVSVGRDVIPPQWAHVLIPASGSITFVVGADGLTPFAHSSVY